MMRLAPDGRKREKRMRSCLMVLVFFICLSSCIVQNNFIGAAGQNPATDFSRRRLPDLVGRNAQNSTRKTAEVPPNTPIVTLEGVCSRPKQNAAAAPCKTVITRKQLDSLVDVLEPNARPSMRRQFAIVYARLLAASEIAERRHLEKNPAVVRELQEKLEFTRVQVLANHLLLAVQENAENVPLSDIQKYYAQHQADFERAEVLRLSLSTSAQTNSGQPLDSSSLRAKMEELRERATAGEDFSQLQQEAYADLRIKGNLPPTKLSIMHRENLLPDEAKAFDLKLGDVSEVLDSQGGFTILKLVSKNFVPVEAARAEIEAVLLREHMHRVLQDATKDIKAQFNLKYLEMSSAPELFPTSLIGPVPTRRGLLPSVPSMPSSE